MDSAKAGMGLPTEAGKMGFEQRWTGETKDKSIG